jgi:hypothetical protein
MKNHELTMANSRGDYFLGLVGGKGKGFHIFIVSILIFRLLETAFTFY